MRLTVLLCASACSSTPHAGTSDASTDASSPVVDATPDGPVFAPTLDGNRDRLLATYLAYLQSTPTITQSNGLSGANLTTVCQLWTALDPSPQEVFLTITHRLEGAVLADHSHALDHITKLYRAVGGEAATAEDPGSCGGGEYNRMIMQFDLALHTASLAANNDKGATPYDIADIPSGGFWRDSHDLGGPHAPFDLSDETNDGAPRGQTQYFKDPTSTAATSPLGREDLTTLVDPYAVEMDQDYDCTHNSNPGCSYTLYGPLCAPEASEPGVQIYTTGYGDFEPAWKPTGC
jgi:hypothetical protein